MNTPLNLGKSNIYIIFWTYVIPSVLMMIVQSTAGFIDSIFVGHYVGPDGLASITLVMPILMILIGLGVMIAVGGTTLAGIEKGAGNQAKSNNFFNVTSSLLLITGFVGALVVFIFIPSLTSLLQASSRVSGYTVEYARYISVFAPFFLLNFAFGYFLKLEGKPILVVSVMLGGTLINIFLDYLFIAKLHLGIKGAALATGASQLLPCIILLILIITKSTWQFKVPKFHRKEIGRLFFNGSSELVSNIAFSVTGIIFNVMIMYRIGEMGVAAYAIALQLAGIAGSISYGIAEGTQAAISYNFGAKQYKRVKAMRNLSLKASFVLGIIFLSMILLFRGSMAGFFVKDLATVSLASNILSFYAVGLLFNGVNISIGTYYTSIDDPIRSALITLYRAFISSIIGLSILPILFGSSGIWMTVIFAECTTFIFGLWMIKRKPLGRIGA